MWLAVYRDPAFRVEIFRDYADRTFDGNLPYADFSYEYLPLSLFILVIPHLLFDMIILWTLSRIGTKPLVLYGMDMLLFWPLLYIRHDLAPVVVATLGTFFLLRGRAFVTAAFWGLGGAFKLYPMAGVPAR